jgi:DNA repair protein RadA/Sms
MVDTVLYFEGDRGHAYRILRSVKNRFGSSNEIGVFEMKDAGLKEVVSPSEVFLAEKPPEAAGSVVVSCMEGTRPILVELQALVCQTSLAVPRRTTVGVDHQRVSLLVAVLEKQLNMALFNRDVFVNVAGGVRVEEPGVDLGVVSAVASSYLDKPLDTKTAVFGEVGLTGEVRCASREEARIKEAEKLGFEKCVVPEMNRKRLENPLGLEIVGVSTVGELVELLF